MKRFQDLQIGDIVGVLKLGGNSVLDFKLDFKEGVYANEAEESLSHMRTGWRR